ncbi:STAS domain-containing protein [Pseudonocardia broussonetiae]|uniref:STAS domain-containing protein n=1 Tax=Pseudonocardia broussonetiae TaxID=2736640 RepID=A0A6M6JG04_9PSEU|nr:STAS domain-containing protein [Pseudonocardia broussonetiae]QJY45319.1 STAS domain-containing protein [Pseudonocardia broussonetiae]
MRSVGAAPGVQVVRLQVDIDLATQDEVAACLASLVRSRGYERVVVDVTDLFVSAHGMQVLAEAVEAAAARGRTWAVAGLNPAIARHVTRWFPGLPLLHDREDAVLAVGGRGSGTPPVDGHDARRRRGAPHDGHRQSGPGG